MLRAQAAQDIPETGKSTRSIAVPGRSLLHSVAELFDRVHKVRQLGAIRIKLDRRRTPRQIHPCTRYPGLVESLRSTLRAQLPHVIPPRGF